MHGAASHPGQAARESRVLPISADQQTPPVLGPENPSYHRYDGGNEWEFNHGYIGEQQVPPRASENDNDEDEI
eukprot:619776-Rhodomonas_salina.1